MIEAFYDALARGQPAGEALRSAKLQMLRAGRPASEWAAFTLVGDPLIQVPLRQPARVTIYWALGAAMATLALGFGLWRRRQRR